MSDEANYEFIDNQDDLLDLSDLILSLEAEDMIGLDTEFMRVTCYYPDFSLMQLAILGVNYIVDVWMLEGRVKPLIRALCNTKAAVLTFACSEDIELLAHEARRIQCTPVLPQRIYDVQLMLAFCGHSFGRGLNFAVQEFLGVTLDKECTRSNWTMRPLTPEQLQYSALDVHYLEPLFNTIKKQMSLRNFEYFCAEMSYICSQFDKNEDEDEAYLRVPAAGMLNDHELNILHYLAKERLLLAQHDNQALNRVITSKAMWQLARFTPRSKRELEHRGVRAGTIRQYGDVILKWISEARKAPRYENLVIPYDYYAHQRDMQENFALLKKEILERAQGSGLCDQVLLKKTLLNDYFRAKSLKQVPLLQQSWRLELLGPIEVPLEPLNPSPNESEEHGDESSGDSTAASTLSSSSASSTSIGSGISTLSSPSAKNIATPAFLLD